jgi:hypothetical protein
VKIRKLLLEYLQKMLVRPRSGCEDNLKMDHRGTDYEGEGWFEQAQENVKRLVRVKKLVEV